MYTLRREWKNEKHFLREKVKSVVFQEEKFSIKKEPAPALN